MKRHLRNIHKTSFRQLRKEGRGDQLIEKTIHKCKLCEAEVLHDYLHLRNHLDGGPHYLSVREYFEQYIYQKDALEVEPVSKQQVRDFSMEETFEDTLELASEQREANISYLQWVSKCQWSCHICNYQTISGPNMSKHLRTSHKTTLKDLKREGKADPLVRKTFHKCVLCKVDVIHDYFYLENHIYGAHNHISVRKYFNNYIYKKNAGISQDKSAKCDSKDIEKYLQDWIKSIRFECQLCKKRIREITPFRIHLRNQHNIKYADYIKVYRPVQLYHNCKICNSKIQHRRMILIQHLRAQHKYDISSYYKEFILPTEELRQNFGLHSFELVHIKELDFGNDAVLDMNLWTNQSKLNCQLCPNYIVSSVPVLTDHIKKNHDMSKNTYLKKYGSFWLEENMKYHKCHICEKEILLCASNMWSHFQKRHNMNLKDYFKKYIRTETFSFSKICELNGELLDSMPPPKRARIHE